MLQFRERFRVYDILAIDVSNYNSNIYLSRNISCELVDDRKLEMLKKFENDFWEPEKLYSLAKRQGGEMFVLFDGEIPVSFAALLKKGSKGSYFNIKKSDAYIGGVFTFSKYRGKGYGTLICDEMLTYAVKEWNSKIITLCVKPENVIAYQVYTKMGFNKISTKRIFLIYKYIIPRYRI